MEKQNKKIFSTILMMVGVLCIVVSGGIFVSRTWQYLPEIFKKMCLVVVAVCFFAGSYYLEKQGKLRKAPLALYYLGVCFTGFSVLAFLPEDFGDLPGRLAISMLGMSVPVLLRFAREKGLADLIIQICLADGMILCIGQYAYLDSGRALLICLSVFTTMLAGLVFYCRNELEGEKGLIYAGLIAYGIHAVITLPMMVVVMMQDKNFCFTVLPALLMVGSWTALYLSFGTKVLRMMQSLSFLICGFSVSNFIIVNLPEGMVKYSVPATVYLAFLAGLVLTVVLGRVELLCTNAGLAGIYCLIQMIEYTATSVSRLDRAICYPYGISMAVTLILWYYFKGAGRDKISVYKVATVFFLMGLNAQAAWFWKEYAIHYGVVFWLALGCMLVAYYLEGDSAKTSVAAAIWKTFALLFGLTAALSNRFISMEFIDGAPRSFLANFSVEYDCFFMGVGIVLLGIIWYSIYQGVRVVQFVGTCLILGTLLLRNLASPALPNVMFLGIVTLGMLVISTILKQRNYAIASAIALAAVVLYLTREVWMSIAWWVYLFVAGVGLVIFAIKKEKAE